MWNLEVIFIRVPGNRPWVPWGARTSCSFPTTPGRARSGTCIFLVTIVHSFPQTTVYTKFKLPVPLPPAVDAYVPAVLYPQVDLEFGLAARDDHQVVVGALYTKGTNFISLFFSFF